MAIHSPSLASVADGDTAKTAVKGARGGMTSGRALEAVPEERGAVGEGVGEAPELAAPCPETLAEIRARNGVAKPSAPDYGEWGRQRRHRYEGCNHASVKPTPDIPEGDLEWVFRAVAFAERLGFDYGTAIDLARAGYGFTKAPDRALSTSKIAPRIVDVPPFGALGVEL